MKRTVLLVVLASLTACGVLTKGGARGPTIQRTDAPTEPNKPSNPSASDERPELGQR